MNIRKYKILVVFLILIFCNQARATDGIIIINSEMPKKDISILATQQIILKPGFVAKGETGNFYARIGNINTATQGVTLNEESGEILTMTGNECISTPMSVKKTFYPTQTLTNYNEVSTLNSINVLEYSDGLDRKCLSVLKNGSPTGHDIAQVVNYEYMNNVQNVWLPTVMSNIQTNNPDLVIQQSLNNYNDRYPYTKIMNAGIVTSYCAPGESYHINEKYSQEILSDEIFEPLMQFDVNDAGNLVLSDFSSISNIFSLKCKKTVDEDGKTIYQYFDEYENIILTRKPEDGGVFADTYYVYDDFKRLRYTLSPECVKLLQTPGVFSLGVKNNWKTDPLALFAYLYNYDERGRCIAKKMPGRDWEYMLYDNGNRLIFSQDGNLRTNNKWIFYKYDRYNRPIQQGTATLGYDTDNIVSLYNQDNAALEDYVAGIGYVQGLKYCTEFKVLKQMFYDSYNYLSTPSFSTYSNILSYDDETSGFGTKYNYVISGNDFSAKGKLTGVYTVMLNTEIDNYSDEIVKALYYDDKDNVIQLRSNNGLGGFDNDYFLYNFNGSLIKKRHVHISPYISEPITEEITYQRDRFSRLLNIKHKINNLPEELICSYAYNELGRVVQKKVHNNGYTMEYAYNIRGQLKSIHSPNFNETLYYEDYNSGQGNYNGNITAITFGGQDHQHYSFTYDAQNRLTSAISGSEGIFNEQIGKYDRNGNIKSLNVMERYMMQIII